MHRQLTDAPQEKAANSGGLRCSKFAVSFCGTSVATCGPVVGPS
jgi:hypothetical protein